ncbi:MAG: protein translocase subunit SecF [Elusimicrobiota bacterium]|nr:protein translocase subunit SecF [Elusimicrobiota bacterium]
MKLIKNLNIDFVKPRRKFFMIPIILLVLLLGVYIYRGGANYGIDFTGGIMMQVSFEKTVEIQDIRTALENSGIKSPELQSSENLFIIKAKQGVDSQAQFENNIKTAMEKAFPGNQMTVEKMEFVGPAVGEYISKQALSAFFFAFLGIIIYIAFRFKSGLWGVAAIIGVIIDVVLSFGFVILTNKEVDITVIAALLTVAGYSINDTIVLFDRLRENLRLNIKEDFATVINKSINAVIFRTVVTSVTVFIVASSLFFLGGEVIHTFAYIMLIGTVLGVYSSLFVCVPVVYEWEMSRKKRALAAKQALPTRSKK